MSDPFNMVPVLIRPINEIQGAIKFPLDRENVEHCWNCGGIVLYVENVLGLVQFDKEQKPMVIAVTQNFYCAHCGSRISGKDNAEDKDIIMTFDDPLDAKDAEFLLSMRDNALTFRNWSEDRFKELKGKIEQHAKMRWPDVKRKK